MSQKSSLPQAAAERGCVQYLLGQKLLELRVLVFERLQPLRLGNIHPAIDLRSRPMLPDPAGDCRTFRPFFEPCGSARPLDQVRPRLAEHFAQAVKQSVSVVVVALVERVAAVPSAASCDGSSTEARARSRIIQHSPRGPRIQAHTGCTIQADGDHGAPDM